MKKIILLTGLVLSTHLILKAQELTTANTAYFQIAPGKNNSLHGTYPGKPLFSIMEDSINRKMNDFDFYMAKSSNKKTAAWLFLGGGALCSGIGILVFPKDYDIVFGNSDGTENQATLSTTLTIIGIAAMIGSIPFFVSSSLNKHRAHVAVGNQKTGYGIPVNPGTIPGLTLSMTLGR